MGIITISGQISNTKIYYQKYTKMIQGAHNEHQQIKVADGELQISINNINEIMSRINQAVKKSHSHLKDHQYGFDTFVTQENLITENVQPEQTDYIAKAKSKNQGLRIPLHQLHRKNKLSTVVEESQSQSGRTHKRATTPRNYETPIAGSIQQERVDHSFAKQLILLGSCDSSPFQTEDGVKSKKIMGIRKTSNFKGDQAQNEQKQQEGKQKGSQTKQKEKEKRYYKTRSMINIRCDIFEKKKQSNLYECETEYKDKSKSKGKKGLSLLSKNSLKSEEKEVALKNIQNSSSNEQRIKAFTEVSSDKKPSGNKTIQVKKRTINPFILSKQSIQVEKKNETKLKNCLSRTNIRDFYVSKRINKKQQ